MQSSSSSALCSPRGEKPFLMFQILCLLYQFSLTSPTSAAHTDFFPIIRLKVAKHAMGPALPAMIGQLPAPRRLFTIIHRLDCILLPTTGF